MPVIDLGPVVGPQGQQGVAGATGAQGIQGNPGPNQVTDQTSTNLVGVLQGSASKVTVKPVDTTPTANSQNLVTSGGVDAGLAVKANQSIIATVETTNVASRNYAVGEYFCLVGVLYRATAAISQGQQFVGGTNCTNTTVGANLGAFRSRLFLSGTHTFSLGAGVHLVIIKKYGQASGIGVYIATYSSGASESSLVPIYEGANKATATISADNLTITTNTTTEVETIDFTALRT